MRIDDKYVFNERHIYLMACNGKTLGCNKIILNNGSSSVLSIKEIFDNYRDDDILVSPFPYGEENFIGTEKDIWTFQYRESENALFFWKHPQDKSPEGCFIELKEIQKNINKKHKNQVELSIKKGGKLIIPLDDWNNLKELIKDKDLRLFGGPNTTLLFSVAPFFSIRYGKTNQKFPDMPIVLKQYKDGKNTVSVELTKKEYENILSGKRMKGIKRDKNGDILIYPQDGDDGLRISQDELSQVFDRIKDRHAFLSFSDSMLGETYQWLLENKRLPSDADIYKIKDEILGQDVLSDYLKNAIEQDIARPSYLWFEIHRQLRRIEESSEKEKS